VLFFDEFDTIAKERGDTHETGEIKRVVSSLLLQADRLPSHVVVVAATNHAELLDRAVWRRMQLRLELPQATRAAKVEWLNAWTARNGVDLGLTPRTIADRLGNVSFAELEEFALDLQRRSEPVNLYETAVRTIYWVELAWSSFAGGSGGLIQDASGSFGGSGGLRTKRSGCAAKAASRTTPRARRICSARP